MTFTFSCTVWILQSTQVCVHVRTFAMQTQSESLHDLGHLHARSSSTASGAGFQSIQSIGRLDSSSAELPMLHLNPTGSRIDGLHCRLRLQIHAWKFARMVSFEGWLCKVVTGATQSLHSSQRKDCIYDHSCHLHLPQMSRKSRLPSRCWGKGRPKGPRIDSVQWILVLHHCLTWQSLGRWVCLYQQKHQLCHIRWRNDN